MKTSPLSLLALIPLLPLFAAGGTALMKRGRRSVAAGLVITAQAAATLVSLLAFLRTLGQEGSPHGTVSEIWNFPWLSLGDQTLSLGLLLDPLGAGMALMVSFVSLLIFIYSVGYMKEDPNFTRFFCFLSLFSAAMLGVVLSNSLLLTFICWELVGLASYLLIGFWFHKPEAAAAAKKAFLTTRIGDMGFLLGMLWLFSASGTLLFYDNGNGCLEQAALTTLATKTVCLGLAVSNGIALLIFCGAAGKSGQFPLHVWLPDAMEGPTPVSALIHAATMVAAGVFLVARMFPVFSATGIVSVALTTVAWIGAFTAFFAALIAVAQTDIKRILAYSTVSQLGFMMLALGVGSVTAAMVHLIAHAFFKALLFLGAGSVIHGVHEEQDIRNMGGLRKFLPVTFVTYAIGMMALCGVPFFFSGFWSKDEILHVAHQWPVSQGPFFLAAAAAFLTAFYMTRQMCYVFAGSYRGEAHPHESPAVMTIPLVLLAAAAVLMSIPATPAWPWFHGHYTGHAITLNLAKLVTHDFLTIAGLSVLIVATGIGFGYLLYRRVGKEDPLARFWAFGFAILARRFHVDELYQATVVRWLGWLGDLAVWIDRWIFSGIVRLVGALSRMASAGSDLFDRFSINLGFDSICDGLRDGGHLFSSWESGRVQAYLRFLGVGALLLLVILGWLLT
ncbi:MAG: NADH-quinone oxidoreductase subunit L [Chthoniobacterales bacterium]|nr:NADH-quinone oxidoreductase subunit L [Chthoniobacterales bacterium]